VKRLLSVLVPFLLVAIPAEVFAKADTSKITIKGADLEGSNRNHGPKDTSKIQCVDRSWHELYRVGLSWDKCKTD
jgi:hypothetical protein